MPSGLKTSGSGSFTYRNIIVSFWHYLSCFTLSSPGEDESPPFRIFYCADLPFLIFFVLFLVELFRLWLYSETTTFPCVEWSPSHLWWSGFWDAQSYASINLFDMPSVLFMVSHFLFMPWCASSWLVACLSLCCCCVSFFSLPLLLPSWAEKGCCFSLILATLKEATLIKRSAAYFLQCLFTKTSPGLLDWCPLKFSLPLLCKHFEQVNSFPDFSKQGAFKCGRDRWLHECSLGHLLIGKVFSTVYRRTILCL